MTETAAPMSTMDVQQGLGRLFTTQFVDVNADAPQDQKKVPPKKAAPQVADTQEGTDTTDELGNTNAEDLEVGDDAETDEIEADAPVEPEFALDLKVNGEEIRITDRAEAIKLAQLGKHFTQRNEQVIQRERQAEERETEANRTRDQYAAYLPEIEAYLANPLGERPKREGFADELSYLKADKQWSEAQERVQAVKAERQRVSQEQQQQNAKAMERWVREQDQAVLVAVPEWNDPAVMQAEGRAMTEYALRQGISQQALANPLLARDKAFVLILRDAMRFQQAQTKGATEVKRVQTQVAPPGAAKQPGEGVSRRRKELEQRTQSGKVQDIAPAMSQLMARTLELQHTPKKPKR